MPEPQEPSHNDRLIGHDAARRAFVQAVNTRLHHAWLLHGPEGVGKTTFALHAAHFLLAGGKGVFGAWETQEKHARLIASGAHPDLLMVSRPVDEKTGAVKDEIPVASVRELTDFFHKTSAMGGWRIVIVRDADRINRNAANALLKVLEEPPSQALILMTAAARGRLLPTIRSRCRSLAFSPLTPAQLEEVTRPWQTGMSADDAALLALLAQGSPGRAQQIMALDGLLLYREIIGLLQHSGPEQASVLLKFAMGFGAKADSERFTLAAQFCIDWLARLLRLAATGQVTEIIGGEGQAMRRMAAMKPLASWFEVADNCRKQFAAAIYANLDRKLVLLQCLQQMTAVR